MFKILDVNINKDEFILLPEEFSKTKIKEPIKYKNLNYKVLEIIKKNEEKIYICKAISNEKLNIKISISENLYKYSKSIRVQKPNIGVSFNKYLPGLNEEILITEINNHKNIMCVHTYLSLEYIEVDNYTELPFFDLRLKDFNENDLNSLKYYISSEKYLWKSLFNTDISYMTDYEKIFQDTFIHKKYVKASCENLANYLRDNGMFLHAEKLIKRGKIHDNSKIYSENELNALTSMINDKGSLTDAKEKLSEAKKDALKLHWTNNSHHPEHFKNYEDMEKIDVFEMICDWHARSIQYKTDLLEFIKIRQDERFHFPKYMFDEIYYYCEVLVNLNKEEV